MKRSAPAIAWVSIAQYFVVEELVRRSYALPYSRRTDFISDLGAVTCGPHNGREVCSPDHIWMNVSFGLVGVAIPLGALLLRAAAPELITAPILALYGAAGVGSVLVALFPEDTIGPLHVLGAAAFFVGSNLGHVLLGSRLRRHLPSYGRVLACVGGLGLVGTGLLVAEEYLGLGAGFVERVVVYAADAGFIATGLALLASGRSLRTGP